MAEKLVGRNYTTPDLVAKVTGRAKFAEDYRADGYEAREFHRDVQR